MNVLCGIVTCNREDLLLRCLNKITEQKLKPDLILIINQGCKLKPLKLNIKTKIITQKNDGSAGGWFTAIKYSIEKKYKLVWLMDDDGYPGKESLYLLIKNFSPQYSCLSSIVLQEQNPNKLVFSMPVINKKKLSDYFFKLKKQNQISNLSLNNLYPFAHLFNGALINSSAIKKIGNVNKDFKMYGEEVDYFYRLKNYGPIYTLITAYHFHPSVKKKFIPTINVYYLLRNSIINNNNHSNFKLIKNLMIIFITLFRVYERNGILFILKFIFFNKNLFLKSIYDGYKR